MIFLYDAIAVVISQTKSDEYECTNGMIGIGNLELNFRVYTTINKITWVLHDKSVLRSHGEKPAVGSSQAESRCAKDIV